MKPQPNEPNILRAITPVIVMTVLVVTAGAVYAQESEAPLATPLPTPVPAPTPIPATEIPDRATEVRSVLRRAVTGTNIGDEVDRIARDFEIEKDQLAALDAETRRRIELDGPATIVEEVQNSWRRTASRLDGWLASLKEFSTSIADRSLQLEEAREIWVLTRESADEVDLPEALREQIDDTLEAINEAHAAMRSNRDAVLTLQSAVARERTAVDEMLATQKEEIAQRRKGVIRIDSPPLWRAFVQPGVHGEPREQLAAMWTQSSETIEQYAAERNERLLRQAFFLVLFIVVLVVIRRHAALWAQQDRSIQRALEFLDRPVAAALVIVLLFGEIFHPNAPRAWSEFVSFLFLLAVLRLLPKILPPSMRSAAYLLATVYFLDKLADLALDGNLVNRLAFLALTLTAAASCWWFVTKLRELGKEIRIGWVRVLNLGVRAAFLVFIVAAVADVVGAVGFATVITEGALSSIYASVVVSLAAMLLRAMVRVVQVTKFARKFGLIRLHADTVRHTFFKLIEVLAVIAWVVITLRGFGAFDGLVDSVGTFLETELSIGDFSMMPADILIFVIVVWLSFKISQLFRFVFEADVTPHLDLPRGVPGTITRLSHYLIIVVGVLMGAAAAGLDFSRVHIILGALGLGISFGLQNVVNNFASGLILLFERPIRVGDKVQIADLFGTVKDIGMRASVVQTLQGAEVIVPNAQLVSESVVNWTLTDERRRVDIPIGVAYGTDPQVVIEILHGVAEEHPDVLDDPAVEALFMGFGDSSLDFELRAWTQAGILKVASDLRVGIAKALEDAAIEIPFPQRDLHLRSVDDDGADGLAKKNAKADEIPSE
jgi:small-conductance mechanosensitive channel